MRARCTCPTHHAYASYGGRGISVCDRWSEYLSFLADMGRRPSPQHSIDRIDNNGNYEPGNCRWATASEQRNNCRQNHVLEFNGRRMTMKQWADVVGLRLGTISERLRRGWSVEDALTKPLQQGGHP